MKRFANRPFVLLGVNSDRRWETAKRAVAQEQLTWRSWWDRGTRGPISRQWRVESWPTLWIIDHEGVLRHRNPRGDALDQIVEALVEEVEELEETRKDEE